MTKIAFLILPLAAALAACGGVTSGGIVPDGGGSSSGGGGSGGGSGSGGSSSGGGSGSSSGGLVPACPAQPPAQGASCATAGLTCEYGSDPNASCDTRASCDGSHFTVTQGGTANACPTSGPGANGCPASYPGSGQACAPQNADCAYPQGRCDCTVALFGPPIVSLDGGLPAPRWACEQPGQGCPEPRPRLGSACSTTGETCDYGSCTLPGGTAAVCTNGVWTETAVPCPL